MTSEIDKNSASKDQAAAQASPRHCAPKIDTKDRLFGASNGSNQKKVRNNPTFKSALFGPDPPSPSRTSKKQIPVIERNPITGEVKIPPRVTV
ncbi:hypothetical protein FO519_002009 [Halicephalobus sp. NKZ332]|nr:hypothetical protein FO519_002009 [Halicephalobus sp. NKZ332]